LGIDPASIIVAGGSAGGNIVRHMTDVKKHTKQCVGGCPGPSGTRSKRAWDHRTGFEHSGHMSPRSLPARQIRVRQLRAKRRCQRRRCAQDALVLGTVHARGRPRRVCPPTLVKKSRGTTTSSCVMYQPQNHPDSNGIQ
jgi:acetyl esterase/lipase